MRSPGTGDWSWIPSLKPISPHSNLQYGLSNPPPFRKDTSFLLLPHPFPSALEWEVWERADGRAMLGPRTETGTKRSALKQESRWERSTGCVEDAVGGPAQGPVPRVAVPGSGQTGPKALPHHCLLHQLSAVCILFIVMEALSHHRQRAFTITKGLLCVDGSLLLLH